MDSEISLENLCAQIKSNEFQSQFISAIDLNDKISSIDELLLFLDALKSNQFILGIELPYLLSEDFDNSFRVLEKLKELFLHNQTLACLKGAINFLHKRICRDLNISCSNGTICLIAVNQDNVNLLNPSEFDYVPFPGGITRSAYFGDEDEYGSVAKIMEIDRSGSLENAVLACKTKKALCELMQYADIWRQTTWSAIPTLEEIEKAVSILPYRFFTRKFGLRTQLIKLDPANIIEKCQTIPELFYVLDALQVIQGSQQKYTADYLKELINKKNTPYDCLPRIYGLRQAVMRIKPTMPSLCTMMVNASPINVQEKHDKSNNKRSNFEKDYVEFDLSYSSGEDYVPSRKRRKIDDS